MSRYSIRSFPPLAESRIECIRNGYSAKKCKYFTKAHTVLTKIYILKINAHFPNHIYKCVQYPQHIGIQM